tara:strand:+ start:2178 stop:2924 length:747 start_codon:yes stop_codon:yes gene_type:complete
MNKLKTVFWDLDGTIADTELSGHRIAFNKAFTEYNLGWNWDIETYKDLLKISGGKKRIKYYASSQKILISDKDVLAIHNNKQIYYKGIINEGRIPLRSGVYRLLLELKKKDIDNYLVTTSGIKATKALLQKSILNYQQLFSGLITYENVINHKPHPEAYLKALYLSNSTHINSLVIEDSEIGLQAAKMAGLKCLISISPWNDFKANSFIEADSVANSLGSIDEETILYRGKSLIQKYVCSDYLVSLLN